MRILASSGKKAKAVNESSKEEGFRLHPPSRGAEEGVTASSVQTRGTHGLGDTGPTSVAGVPCQDIVNRIAVLDIRSSAAEESFSVDLVNAAGNILADVLAATHRRRALVIVWLLDGGATNHVIRDAGLVLSKNRSNA